MNTNEAAARNAYQLAEREDLAGRVELYRFFVDGDTVIVELALQGTQKEPLELPLGTIQPTGQRMDAPCCAVFRLKKRQDSILRLLSVRHGDLDAIARSSNIEMSSSSLHFTREERIER